MTEYGFIGNLIFWGDGLQSDRLVRDLGLTVEECRSKGQRLGDQEYMVAKTGLLNCALEPRGSATRRDPPLQFEMAIRALKQLTGTLPDEYGATDAALHISIYYRDRMDEGVPDFVFPPELLALLVRFNIELKFTVLP